MFGTPLQEWLEPPKNTTVPEGRDAVLACRVKNKVNNIAWGCLNIAKGGPVLLAEEQPSDLLVPG